MFLLLCNKPPPKLGDHKQPPFCLFMILWVGWDAGGGSSAVSGYSMLLQSGDGWDQNFQAGYTHVSGTLVRTIRMLDLLSVSFSSCGFLCMTSFGFFFFFFPMPGRPSHVSIYQSSACSMLAALSLDKVSVGGAYTTTNKWRVNLGAGTTGVKVYSPGSVSLLILQQHLLSL